MATNHRLTLIVNKLTANPDQLIYEALTKDDLDFLEDMTGCKAEPHPDATTFGALPMGAMFTDPDDTIRGTYIRTLQGAVFVDEDLGEVDMLYPGEFEDDSEVVRIVEGAATRALNLAEIIRSFISERQREVDDMRADVEPIVSAMLSLNAQPTGE